MRENRYEVLSRFVYHQDGNDLPGNESNPLLFRISSDYINIYRIAIRAIASMLHIAYFKTLFMSDFFNFSGYLLSCSLSIEDNFINGYVMFIGSPIDIVGYSNIYTFSFPFAVLELWMNVKEKRYHLLCLVISAINACNFHIRI